MFKDLITPHSNILQKNCMKKTYVPLIVSFILSAFKSNVIILSCIQSGKDRKAFLHNFKF